MTAQISTLPIGSVFEYENEKWLLIYRDTYDAVAQKLSEDINYDFDLELFVEVIH
mgnify:CR=1 FL=1